MSYGYMSMQAVEELLAVKEGEKDFILKQLQEQIKINAALLAELAKK